MISQTVFALRILTCVLRDLIGILPPASVFGARVPCRGFLSGSFPDSFSGSVLFMCWFLFAVPSRCPFQVCFRVSSRLVPFLVPFRSPFQVLFWDSDGSHKFLFVAFDRLPPFGFLVGFPFWVSFRVLVRTPSQIPFRVLAWAPSWVPSNFPFRFCFGFFFGLLSLDLSSGSDVGS